MNRKSNLASFALAVTLGLLAGFLGSDSSYAQPPGKGGGGGGGGGSTIEGTIYFRHAGAMWQMDGNGAPSSRIALPDAPDYGFPSHALHGGERWFVYDDGWFPELHPPFPNERQFTEIMAGSTAGDRVLLVSDSGLEIISSPQWSRNDGSITFIAERWGMDADGEPYAFDAGLYRLPITFAGGIPVAGLLQFVDDMQVIKGVRPL